MTDIEIKNREKFSAKSKVWIGIAIVCIIALIGISIYQGKNDERTYFVPKSLIVKSMPDTVTTSIVGGKKKFMSSEDKEQLRLEQINKMTYDMYSLHIESSQGGNQVRLFFDTFTHLPDSIGASYDSSPDLNNKQWGYVNSKTTWYANIATYIICALLVFIVLTALYRRKDSLQDSFLKNFTTRKAIILYGTISMALAIGNLAMPFDGGHLAELQRADPYFVLVCFFAIGMAIASYKRMFARLRHYKMRASNLLVRKEHFRYTIMWAAIGTFSLGFLCYFMGMYTIGTQKSVLASLVRPAFAASKMFLLADSVGDCSYVFRQNGAFMGFYSLLRLAFLAISSVAVISLLGDRVKAYFDIKNHNEVGCLYVFFGLNENTKMLAKDIIRETPKEKYTIVFVEPRDSQSDSIFEGISFSNLLSLFTLRKNLYPEVKQVGDETLLVVSNVVINQGDVSGLIDDIIKETHHVSEARAIHTLNDSLGFSRLYEIIKKASYCHYFFLNEDTQSNISGTQNLRKYMDVVKIASKSKIYCQARNNNINKAFQDIDYSTDVEVRIIDPSSLSIDCLKLNVKHQPVSFVDVVRPRTDGVKDVEPKNNENRNLGTVTSAFTSLIVGFGETGKDALRFLYEFGAFVDHNSDESHTFRSQFNCHVVDREINSMRGPITNASPTVFSSTNYKDNSLLVQLHDLDYTSHHFFNILLPKIIERLNYVVIAIGDDEAGMTLAVRILKYAMRQGRDFSKLKIFVRSYNPALVNRMQKIADHYNEGEERIIVFGSKANIYSYKIIINNEYEERGKDYYNAYRRLRPNDDTTGTWEQRRKKVIGMIKLKRIGIDPSTGYAIFEEIPQYSRKVSLTSLQELRRKTTQDKANALHESTKMRILVEVFPNWYERLVPGLFTKVDGRDIVIINKGAKHYPYVYDNLNEEEQLVMENLAKLEHIRWNASHEVMGYRPQPIEERPRGCNELLLTHNCLVSWEDLVMESQITGYDYKSYDYAVVETTINVYRNLIEKENNNNQD